MLSKKRYKRICVRILDNKKLFSVVSIGFNICIRSVFAHKYTILILFAKIIHKINAVIMGFGNAVITDHISNLSAVFATKNVNYIRRRFIIKTLRIKRTFKITAHMFNIKPIRLHSNISQLPY